MTYDEWCDAGDPLDGCACGDAHPRSEWRKFEAAQVALEDQLNREGREPTDMERAELEAVCPRGCRAEREHIPSCSICRRDHGLEIIHACE